MFGEACYDYMYKNLFYLNRFAKDKSIDFILELPVEIIGDDIISTLTKKYLEYKKLLCMFFREEFEYEDKQDLLMKDLDVIQDSIINILSKNNHSDNESEARLCRIIQKHHLFEKMKRPLNTNEVLYRFCNYSPSLCEDKDFYHCPFDKPTNGKRFCPAGKHHWFLGYSEDVCKYETHEGEIGSMALLKSIDERELSVVDLTQDGLFEDNGSEIEYDCYIMWWLLACCYCYCPNRKDEENGAYIISQILSRYIEDTIPDIIGIRYYTVRNVRLNPDERTYVNLALFTKKVNDEQYDMNLCGKFKVIKSFQNYSVNNINTL